MHPFDIPNTNNSNTQTLTNNGKIIIIQASSNFTVHSAIYKIRSIKYIRNTNNRTYPQTQPTYYPIEYTYTLLDDDEVAQHCSPALYTVIMDVTCTLHTGHRSLYLMLSSAHSLQ